MEKHYGEIIEMVVRRNGYSISELARSLRLNRRSIYNWFSRPKLRVEIIFNLGCALRYDFSREFPELFSSEDFSKVLYKNKLNNITFFTEEEERANYWRNKYVNMLEEYNQMLSTVETDSNLKYS
ncbi:terminase gpP N-terminus-related DNA-binding protein [Olivibacter domesticus]|uniref:Terminase ATPase subunit N-terminal domain-containing protein n=1 Tax=Olivibacter domesticus TaxID=407022 RepID=A0A1H7KGJ1_OLID1|nr:hypothetical protein [Olivibacter domesticus]SEK85971.1 hypothetical protein SAMN05661044_01347 [Olivibacter domesticus]